MCVYFLTLVSYVDCRRPDSLGPQQKSVSKKLFPPKAGAVSRAEIYSPEISSGVMDGASAEEFTGMRAEFTSANWFDSVQGKANRRLHSWYGYYGGNMNWQGLMHLICKVHFP